MNATRMLVLARKNLVEIAREPVLLGLTLLLPAFFMLITYAGYGSTPKTATYPIWIIRNTPQADAWIERLQAERYADGRPVYALTFPRDRAEAERALVSQRAAVLLVFDEGDNGLARTTLRSDALNMAYTKASVQLETSLVPLMEAAQGKLVVWQMVDRPIARARPVSDFEAYTPGMMVFAILMIIPQTAVLIGREMRKGTLRRLELTRLSTLELLGGVSLAQMAVSVVQVGLMFGMALLLGFHNHGSLALAVGIGLALCFGSVGAGLVMAAFVRNDTDALNTGSAVSMVMVFLSGAFFAMPAPTLFTLAGHQVSAFDFIPATHGMLALQQVMSGGAGLGQVAFRVAAALLLSVAYFILGVVVFKRKSRALGSR